MTTNALDLCNACDSARAVTAGGYCAECDPARPDYFGDGGGPMLCDDCGRPALYDYTIDDYRHALDPATGCFLIAADPDYPGDPNHPLLAVPGTAWKRTR